MIFRIILSAVFGIDTPRKCLILISISTAINKLVLPVKTYSPLCSFFPTDATLQVCCYSTGILITNEHHSLSLPLEAFTARTLPLSWIIFILSMFQVKSKFHSVFPKKCSGTESTYCRIIWNKSQLFLSIIILLRDFVIYLKGFTCFLKEKET